MRIINKKMLNIFELQNKREIVCSVIFTLLCSGVLMLNLMNISERYEWVTTGTGIQTSIEKEYEFTPFLSQSDDVISQKFCPRYSGLKTIEIRLANEWPDDMSCTLTFSISELDGEVIWRQEVDSDNIENWRYYPLNLSTELEKGKVYNLEIQCLENEGGVPYKIFLCNEKLKENEKLSYNDESLDGGLDLMYKYYVFPTWKIICIFLIIILSIITSWVKKVHFQKRIFNSSVILVIFAFMSLWMVERLSFNNIFSLGELAIIINFILFLGINFFLWGVFNSSMAAGIISNGFMVVVATVNHYTLIFRGTVILPSDIYSISTAYNVAENYEIIIDAMVQDLLIYFLVISIILYKTNSYNTTKKRIGAGISGLICLFVVSIISVDSNIAQRLELQIQQDSQTNRSHEIGFWLNLCENLKHFYIQKPEGYSKEKVKKIYEKNALKDSIVQSNVQPNIIVIMNETFTDLKYLGDLKTNEAYMENFYKAAQEENSKVGKCVVSVYGGGTSCSEFEFLTGSTMTFLGSGNAPYQQYIHSTIEALPAYLKQDGYTTYAIHAANPLSWNRNVAYPLLGFDNFISSENEEFKDATYCRYWIDDQSMVDELKTLYYNSTQPTFLFGLTIQCHGGYDYENYENIIEVQNLSQEYSDVNQYLSLVYETDMAFGNLIDDLKQSEIPTIVLMYGDHLPRLSDEFYEELIGKSKEEYTEEDYLQQYETPYIFWANYDADFSDVPDIISANFLAPYLLRAAGIELNSYYEYLYSLSKRYPVISRAGIMNIDGEIVQYEGEFKYNEDIKDYEIVQYDYLTGN